MAEAIGLASGVLTLVSFAGKSGIGLYDTIESYKFHPKQVRDLKEELEALNGVLNALHETVRVATDVDFSALDMPLRRCDNACKEFKEEIIKCSSRSHADRTSFRDWAKLRYMGSGIDGFRQLLAGYKSTINVALTDATLRKSSVTAQAIESYKALIKSANDDLEAHLQDVNEKLEAIFERTVAGSDPDAAELRRIREEQLSTKKGLQICAQLSEHIRQIQQENGTLNDGNPTTPLMTSKFPGKVINEGLQQCRDNLSLTTTRLESHMRQLIDRLAAKSKTAMSSEDDIENLIRLQDEWEAARECLGICSKADTQLKEDISIIENYATGDEAVQFLVSTNNKTIHGRNEGLGWRPRQVGGHISDDSLQQLSRDISSISIPSNGHSTSTSLPPSNGDSPRSNVAEDKGTSEFRDRYGRGFRLSPKSSARLSSRSSTEFIPAHEASVKTTISPHEGQ